MSAGRVSMPTGLILRLLLRDPVRREAYLGDLSEEWFEVAGRSDAGVAERWMRSELRRGLVAFALRDARIALTVGVIPIVVGYVAHVVLMTEANRLDAAVRAVAGAMGGGSAYTILRLGLSLLCGLLAGVVAAAACPRRPVAAAAAFAIGCVPIAFLMYPGAGADLPQVLRIAFRLTVVPAGILGGVLVYLLGRGADASAGIHTNEDA